MIDRAQLMDAQQAVAAGLLGEGIKVVYDATTPHADLTNRVMHLRPLPQELDDAALLHLRADCDHELGHFGVTDPAVLSTIARPLVGLIANAIEDGLVERWVSARWLGCAENLNESNAALLREIRDSATDERQNQRARAVTALQSLAFGKSRASVLKSLGEDIDPLLDEIGEFLPELAGVNNTAMSLDLATRIADRWAWGKKQPSAKKKKKKRKKQSAQSPPGQDSVPGSAATHATSVGQQRREREIAREIARESLGERRKEKITKLAFVAGQHYRAYTAEDDFTRLRPIAGSPHVHLERVRSLVPPLRRRLLMELRGVAPEPVHAQVTGQLDRAALHRVAFGHRDVFEQEQESVVVDADITLLVDLSASMAAPVPIEGVSAEHWPRRIDIASDAATAFSMTLDLIGVPHECLGFTTRCRIGRALDRFDREFERVRPLRLMIVKDAKEPFQSAARRFAALPLFEGMAENIDGESLLWAARRLAERHRHGLKPVLIVFSDGEPLSSPERQRCLNAHLKRAVARVERSGIHVIGVGIGTDSVRSFYSHHVVVNKIEDLVSVTYGLLRAIGRDAQERL